jgi:hypothetical protein
MMYYVYNTLSDYKQIYDEKRNNTIKPTWTYFWTVTPPQEQPKSVTSWRIAEGIVIIWAVNIAPEARPVGQDVEMEDSRSKCTDIKLTADNGKV